MPMRIPIRFPVATLVFLSSSAAAGTIYVDENVAQGLNNGSSWANAYRGVDAVAVAVTASVAGDEIWVAAGTYKPTTTNTRTISHTLKTGVSVYGGFNGTETLLSQRDPAANLTILSGNIGQQGNIADNSHHVVNGAGADASAVLDGFRITAGNADAATGTHSRGGGILCMASTSPTIRNCHFVDNRATAGGGAGYVMQASPTFVGSIFESNLGGTAGGAFGTDTTSTIWDRCTFLGNSAGRAGAVECGGMGSPRILNCLFRDNVATSMFSGGGAIGTTASTQIRNCTIVENSSTNTDAGGIEVIGGAPTIANCIVVDNSGPGGAQGAVNQIGGAPASVTHSIVEGGIAGTGNLNVVPGFTNQAGNDFTLSIASPAIDRGNNSSLPLGFVLDLAGRNRFFDEPTVADTGVGTAPIVDIGCFEFPAPIVVAFCFGDGTGATCPCGNDAPFFTATGCLNSLGLGGLLASSGAARILTDTLVLQGSGMPNSSCLYFQGTTQLNGGLGNVFGDGLRCAGGSVIRLATKSNVAGASQFPAGGDPSISVRGAVLAVGSVRTYQSWYRNAAAFCAPQTFNLTNGLQVSWEL